MREIIARLVSIATVCAVGALSLLFAYVHNSHEQPATASRATPSRPVAAETTTAPSAPAPATPPVSKGDAPAASIDRGRTVYEEQRCATCHSIAGEGNPRNPLDGVGVTWEAKEMEEWITGAGSVAEVLPAAIVKRKQRYQALPREDMNALMAYLSTLKAAK